jgi:hypothetical protein
MRVGQDTERFAFPMVEAELTDDVIDECGLRRGLTKLGKRLIAQLEKSHGTVGVDIKRIGFVMQLKQEPTESEGT